MDALRTIPTGFENVQNLQNTRAAETVMAQRERDSVQPQSARLERAPQPSVQVNLSETGRAAARSDSPPTSASAPVQTQAAIPSANSARNAENRDTATSTAAGREAVQRYMENAANNANKLPAGQSRPSAVRVSA